MIINCNKKLINRKYLNVINKALDFAIDTLQIPCKELEMDINFVSSEEIKRLNSEFRNKDMETDVLSFPNLLSTGEDFQIIDKSISKENYPMDISPDTGCISIGSICICKNVAYAHAKEYQNSKMREIVYMAVHGFLHLMGYDHINEEDKKIMRKKEEEIMSYVNLRRK